MSNRIYVGGLSWDTDDAGLRAAFETYGAIQDVKVITDRESGRSRGFGFVTYDTAEDAGKAMAEMNGTVLDGRTLRVAEAKEREGGGGDRRRRY